MATLADLTQQQQVIDYLMQTYGDTPLSYTVNPTENEAGQQIMGVPWASTDDGQSVRQLGNYLDESNLQGWQTTGYERQLTDNFDPNYEGGVYGSYVGDYDAQGNLNDVRFVEGERHKGFIGENMDWLGPLMVLAPAALMAASEIAAGLGAAESASTGLTAAEIADLGMISGATNAGAGTAFEAALANSAFGAGAGITAGTGTATTAGGLDIVTDLAPAALAKSAFGAGTATTAGGLDIVTGLAPAAGGAGAGSGISDLLTMQNAGKALQAAGLIGAALESNSGGGGGASNNVNLITPKTLTRTPTGTPVTSQQAYSYLLGKPTGTTQPLTSQQKWFNNQWTQGVTYDPASGKQYVPDPTTGQLREVLTQPPQTAQTKQTKQTNQTNTLTETAANGGLMALAAGGGVDGHLGGYSDGGRLLRGPGDGVSDSIPAVIGGKQPARLADGEFVVPARIVSELGNGSTEAGARKLYAMMDRIQQGRSKSIGKGRVAVNSKADKHLPA